MDCKQATRINRNPPEVDSVHRNRPARDQGDGVLPLLHHGGQNGAGKPHLGGGYTNGRWRIGNPSPVHNDATPQSPSRVSVSL